MTRAMILAAGRGARMRPLTAMAPKPLIEVAGKALIDHVFDRLEAADAGPFVVNVHYLPDLLEVHVKRRASEKVTVSDERAQILDTGGGVKRALPLLGEAPFIVTNADTFWIEGPSQNLAQMQKVFDPERMDGLLLLAPTVRAVGYEGRGDFSLTPDGRVRRRETGMVAPFVYAGCAIFSPAAFAQTPDGPFSLNLVFDALVASGRLYGIRLDGLFLHVGTPDAIREAERAIRASAA
ncbi:MAG: nucleotidyltransferase family protein [Pseudomonadota bacterium]